MVMEALSGSDGDGARHAPTAGGMQRGDGKSSPCQDRFRLRKHILLLGKLRIAGAHDGAKIIQ